MRYQQQVTLKDGTAIVLRSLERQDAGAAVFCFRKVAGETDFLLRETDECGVTIAQEEEILARKADDPREMLLGVFFGNELIGMAGLNAAGQLSRVRHRASVGVSLVRAHWGKGIGTAMMHAVIECAKEAGYEQLELEVVKDNTRAIALYARFGFVSIGRIPNAIKYRGGRYADMCLMIRQFGKDCLEI